MTAADAMPAAGGTATAPDLQLLAEEMAQVVGLESAPVGYEKNGDLTDETRLPELVESMLSAVDAATGRGAQWRRATVRPRPS